MWINEFVTIITGVVLMAIICGCGESIVPPGEGEKNYTEMIERTRAKKIARHNTSILQEKVKEFQLRFGRSPTNLVELVQHQFVSSIPEAPPGMQYLYSPTLGNVRLGKIQNSPASAPSGPR